MPKRMNLSDRDSDAVFVGRQKTPCGTTVALYTITAVSHPSHGSTVSEETLRDLDLNVPEDPLVKKERHSVDPHYLHGERIGRAGEGVLR